MKALILAALLPASAFAQEWTETFKLPEGTTYRARAAGYDCGAFGGAYVQAPATFRERGIEFKQLSADKDLNKFLFEAVFPGEHGQQCIYGVFLDRNRDDKTLDFTHSEIVTVERVQGGCSATQAFLDGELRSVAYEGSRRGLRYVAVQVVKDTPNDVCESGNVRVVFDRRF